MGAQRHGFVLAALIAAALMLGSREARADEQLLAFGEGGLRLGAATTLHAKPVTAAAYDPLQELVWFVSGGTLSVIDLRDTKRKPVAIAKKMPAGAFAVSGLSTAEFDTDYAGLFPIIDLGKKIKIKEGAGAYGGLWEDNDKRDRKALKKVKVVGAAWLKKQKKRRARPGNEPPAAGQWGTQIVLPEGVGECDGSSLDCGESQSFGTTAFKLVVVSSACGDACGASCVLFDPGSKRWASPVTSGEWSTTLTADTATGPCWDYGFRGDGSYYAGSVTCTAAGSIQCVDDDAWMNVGWADAERALTAVPEVAQASGGAQTSAAAMVELRALKGKMCACKDQACANQVMSELEAMSDRYATVKGSDAEQKEAAELATAMMNCMSGLH